MNILILEDTDFRINYFIDHLSIHNLSIADNIEDTIEYLSSDVYDYIFLDIANKDGLNVIEYLENNLDNKNTSSTIIIHSWNMLEVLSLIKASSFLMEHLPFGSEKFIKYLTTIN